MLSYFVFQLFYHIQYHIVTLLALVSVAVNAYSMSCYTVYICLGNLYLIS